MSPFQPTEYHNECLRVFKHPTSLLNFEIEALNSAFDFVSSSNSHFNFHVYRYKYLFPHS